MENTITRAECAFFCLPNALYSGSLAAMSQSCCIFAFLVVSLLGAPAILAGTISIPATSQASFQESQAFSRPRNVGQTFVVPSPTSESLLTDFSFNITNVPNGDLDYEAYLFQWNPGSNAPIGGALFQSGMQTAIATGVVQFTGLNLSLNPALTYVALLSTQGPVPFNDNEELGNVGSNATAPYAGGAFVR
ncbi:MAG: hypothetical protein O3C21_03040 [Verrucomicrobia bacterium]|nr:hypothetical protein [Verrucomicrobiota bacterium]